MEYNIEDRREIVIGYISRTNELSIDENLFTIRISKCKQVLFNGVWLDEDVEIIVDYDKENPMSFYNAIKTLKNYKVSIIIDDDYNEVVTKKLEEFEER